MHPIHVFGPNSDVLVRFCQFRYCAKNHANVAFNAPIRVVNETMHSFDPETKRTHPIQDFGPNSDVLVRFCQFRYCAKNHANVAFNAPIRVVNETMHSFDPETKRTHPIQVFGPNSDVLVRFCQFRDCAKNHANVAFNAPIWVVNETMHSFGPETKRTHPIHVFGPKSDVLVHFRQFRYGAKNHANVAFNAPIRVVNETMHSFDPETKRTNPIHVLGHNSDVLVRFGQFRYYAKTMQMLHLMHPFGSLTKRCTVLIQKRNERTQSTFLDPIVMFWFVFVSFITVQKTMQMLHLMHPFGSLTKRCTVSIQKRNERTQSKFLDPIVMFWFVFVSFVTVQKTMQMLHLMHPFGSLTKRCTVSIQKRNERTQSTFLDPIVMFWFVFVSFVTVQKTMQMLHLMHLFGSLTKRRTVSIQKRNERTQSMFLDPIVMFWFVLFSFVILQKTMQMLHLMHPFGSLTKRCTVSIQK